MICYCYPKEENGIVYIYEKGETFKNGLRKRVKVDRKFLDYNGDPLTSYCIQDAMLFCKTRNEIMNMECY